MDQIKFGPGTIYSPLFRFKSFVQRDRPFGLSCLTIENKELLYDISL